LALTEVEAVIAWHEALNEGDVERLLALCSEDVEVGGPLGSARGSQALRDWFERAGLRLELTAFLQRSEVVVVTQEAEWPSDTALASEPQAVASVFRVRHGVIVSVFRYDDLESALVAAGIRKA
jgi:ketosteroid isomerase-like protein